MKAHIVLFALLSSLIVVDCYAAEGISPEVVIRASFSPRSILTCVVPEIKPETDGIGAWYVGAPCQRMSANPGEPGCWKPIEDNCLTITNESILVLDGYCPSVPCEAEYDADIGFTEPCKPPCNQVKCCESGMLYVTDYNTGLGFIATGTVWPFQAVSSCVCEEGDDKKCVVAFQVQCRDSFGYFYEMTHFGYQYQCLSCE